MIEGTPIGVDAATHIMQFQPMRGMGARRRAERRLTWREINAKYAARGRASAVLVMNDVSEWPGHATKFVVMCRILLDIGSRASGGRNDIVDVTDGPVPKFDMDNTFCPIPERTTTLAPPPPETEAADGRVWIRARWAELDYRVHLLVNTDAWRIHAFCLSDDSDKGATLLARMLKSALETYAVDGIPMPRAVAKFMDAAYVKTVGPQQSLDGWNSGPDQPRSLKKSRLNARPRPQTGTG